MLGCLIGFASLALAQSQMPRAARLLGAVTALLRTTGHDLHNFLATKSAYDRAMETVRPAMEQPEWAEAWALGRAMSLADAVAFALD
jgi:hypothetical protein